MTKGKPSEELWSDLRVWYPPFDPNGRYYTTKYVETKNEDGVETVILSLTPEGETLD